MCNRLLLKYGAIKNIIRIRKKLKKRARGMIDSTIFLLLFLFSLISLDMAIGSPREHSVINKLKVGSIKE